MGVVTLGQLRSDMAVCMGEGQSGPTGTFTATPTSSQATDTARSDPSNYWNNGWIQDTTVPGGTIARITSYLSPTFNIANAFIGGASAGDSYEVHKLLSFVELRQAVNMGISLCGKALRTLVRDQSQVVQAQVYIYKPNYSGSVNVFFPTGVTRIEIQWQLGIATYPYLDIPGWSWLDDENIQFPVDYVDAFVGNPIRFTGYGPVAAQVTTDNPTQVIATFDDAFAEYALAWGCTQAAWQLIAAKLTAGERAAAQANADNAGKQWAAYLANWKRPPIVPRQAVIPTDTSGWNGHGLGWRGW